MEEKRHPELQRLLDAAGRIISLCPIGESRTDLFWIRFSKDCSFLEFSNNFRNELAWRLKIEFYPSGETVEDINQIILVGGGEIWRVSCHHGICIKHEIVRSRPHVHYHWSICDGSDIALLTYFQVGSLGESGYGSVSYARDYDGGWNNKWSHGTTSGYPWTRETPETLRDGEDTLITEVCSVPVIPQISIKEVIDRIISTAYFSELEESLKRKKDRKEKEKQQVAA